MENTIDFNKLITQLTFVGIVITLAMYGYVFLFPALAFALIGKF